MFINKIINIIIMKYTVIIINIDNKITILFKSSKWLPK